MPKNFEVWFLSEDRTSFLDKILPKKKSVLVAQNYQCQPMGEFCFDPQIGLYKKGEAQALDAQIENSQFENSQSYDFLEPAKSVEREMIDCEESTFFDVFCGKAQKQLKQGLTPLEVWIDTSSTMKQVDFKGYDQKCSREIFLDHLSQTCPLNKKMKVYYFTEFKKEAGSFDRVCMSSGLNNLKRLKEDIEKSKANNLIIITDIFEAQEEFITWIEATGSGKVKGIEKPLYASSIHKELKRIRKMCK